MHILRSMPEVLFVCVHNAGRSQMAAALLDHLSDGSVTVRSAGSEPVDRIKPNGRRCSRTAWSASPTL